MIMHNMIYYPSQVGFFDNNDGISINILLTTTIIVYSKVH